MNDLARQLAVDKDWTWAPGMACRDPETGVRWRFCVEQWVSEGTPEPGGRMTPRVWLSTIAVSWLAHADLGDRESTASCARALAAGPLLSDAATVGCLLADVRRRWRADDCHTRKTVDLNGTCWVVESWIVRERMDEAAGAYTGHGTPAALGPDELGKRATTEAGALAAAWLAAPEVKP